MAYETNNETGETWFDYEVTEANIWTAEDEIEEQVMNLAGYLKSKDKMEAIGKIYVALETIREEVADLKEEVQAMYRNNEKLKELLTEATKKEES